jgi:hypothetical protein
MTGREYEIDDVTAYVGADNDLSNIFTTMKEFFLNDGSNSVNEVFDSLIDVLVKWQVSKFPQYYDTYSQ